MRWQSWIARYGTSFSFVGLALGAVFFSASLTPSLLPRTYMTQGALSGFALALGYGVGVLTVRLWLYLELPPPGARLARVSRWLTSVGVSLVVALSLWRATVWRNSLRGLMEMEPLETAYPLRVALIAVVVAAVLVALARILGRGTAVVAHRFNAILPRRVSYVLGVVVVGFVTISLVNGVLLRRALDAADATFSELDALVDEETPPPSHPLASGSAASLIDWDSIGRQGKRFVVSGPTRDELGRFLGRPGQRWGPMRFVYLQYASDPMVFFSKTLAFRKPAWLVGERGPDVSPYLRWVPLVTFLQVAFDIPMATTVPTGYGHNYAPAHYIDAWVAVTDPEGWGPDDTARLKERFTDVHPRP